ncbi:nucleoside transporter 2, putative [Plasmodium gallinaceum]|uniref:Nucleoside transporter 2, putative n=1 Tax=Plasmodium gallinaceum TaxID=5849 RepID=A0A1J1GM22_PLAGA|nr:nucleoside transporter 2, putative [Plasmodium gallinaceum]CRG93470.1 nucleoside transporter 2, putative [Plasmodium gallinaceum]
MNLLNNKGNDIEGDKKNKLDNENEENQLSKNNDESIFDKKCKQEILKEKKDEHKDINIHQKNSLNDDVIFSNVTLCLMGMSSVILYNYVLNTTPHIHAMLNKNIMISFTFFLYFFVLVIVSLVSSLLLEVKIITYDICFILSFVFQLIYPYIVKYYYDRTFFFYFLICCIGGICSILKTMIFSIASIVLNSSKVVCLSYGLTGIYSFFLTSLFYYFIIKVDKNVEKLQLSLFITSTINCMLILCSFICYSLLKRTKNFKKKFKIYTEERKHEKESEKFYYENILDQNTLDASYSISINVIKDVDNTDGKYYLTENENVNAGKKKKGEEKYTNNTDNQIKEKMTSNNVSFNKPVNNNKSNTISLATKNKFCNKLLLYKRNMRNFMKRAKHKTFLYRKAFISLFCVFYNIFLKVIVFPVVCPEIWTKNVDERYILIGIVQVADCVSRIFPTFAQSFPILKFFLLPQKKVLLYSFARTFLSLLCLIIPITKSHIFHNFIFKCLLIFANIYLNGWFVTLSFINIPSVLKSFNSLSNAAIVNSFGSTLLRVGLLAGYGASTIYKYFVTQFITYNS